MVGKYFGEVEKYLLNEWRILHKYLGKKNANNDLENVAGNFEKDLTSYLIKGRITLKEGDEVMHLKGRKKSVCRVARSARSGQYRGRSFKTIEDGVPFYYRDNETGIIQKTYLPKPISASKIIFRKRAKRIK